MPMNPRTMMMLSDQTIKAIFGEDRFFDVTQDVELTATFEPVEP